MKNKILYLLYYILAFVISKILIDLFLLKIVPTFHHYLRTTWVIIIFECVVIAIFLLAAAEFVYRKTNQKNIFLPCVLILCLQIFSIRHSLLILVSGINAGLILYIITKSNKLILQNVYKYLLLVLWISVLIVVVYNYLIYAPLAGSYQRYAFAVILLILFLAAISRLGFILRKTK